MFLPHDWQSDLCFLHASTVVHNSKNRDTASLIQCIWNQASNQNTVYSSWHFILLLYFFSVSPWRGGGRDGEVSTWCQELLCPVTPSTCIINCVVPLCVCDSATERHWTRNYTRVSNTLAESRSTTATPFTLCLLCLSTINSVKVKIILICNLF